MSIETPEELAALTRIGRVVGQTIARVKEAVRPGVTAEQVELRYVELVAAIRREITIPLAVKLSPSFTAGAHSGGEYERRVNLFIDAQQGASIVNGDALSCADDGGRGVRRSPVGGV